MIIICPICSSENVTNLSYDSNDFICNDCGEDFQHENGIQLDEENESSGFIDLDPNTALKILDRAKRENNEDSLED